MTTVKGYINTNNPYRNMSRLRCCSL